MTLESRLASAFAMDERTWARHANPWSVYTRATALPLLIAALWSRAWLGWPGALALCAIAVAWTWFNPRLFPPPASTKNWASEAVLGERIWLNRQHVAVPPHHRTLPHILSGLSALGMIPIVWGLWHLAAWPTLSGIGLVLLSKFWFLDRMVWLYADMRDATPEYARWHY